MKYLLTLYGILILMGFSCFETLELDHNTQIRVKGIVTDEDGKPLVGIPVYLEAYVENFDDTGLVQSVTSKGDGTYSFMFSGSNAKFFILHINRKIKGEKQSLLNPKFAEKTLLFSNKFIKDFEVDFSQYGKLDKASKLILKCNITDESKAILITTSSNDIQIDTALENSSDFLFFHNLKAKDILCSEPDTIYLKRLDSVFIKYNLNNSIFIDTIFIKDHFYTYNLRN